VAFTIPFAFAIGALVTRRLDAEWIRATRRFSLIAWTFLGFGLLLGARWSYTELGWGGYWAWDPVENAALMPWLLGTAFLHSIMVQEKRGMLKVWNATLIVATFSMALLGTFLVRSGVLQSIHAFGDSTVGPYILGLIAVVLVGSTALIVSRLDDLRSEKRIDSLFSARVDIPRQQLLAGGALRGDLLGHDVPADRGAVHRRQASLAAPWFDRYTTRWRSCSSSSPASAAARLAPGHLGVGAARLRRSGSGRPGRWGWNGGAIRHRPAALGASPCSPSRPRAHRAGPGALAGRGGEAGSSSGGSIPGAIFAVAARNRRRYGGYVVHAGIAVLLIGVAASSSFQTNREVNLRPTARPSTDTRSTTSGPRSVSTTSASPSAPCSTSPGQPAVHDPSHPRLLPTRKLPAATADQLLFRRRVDQRGGAAARTAQGLLDRRAAEHRSVLHATPATRTEVPAPCPGPDAFGRGVAEPAGDLPAGGAAAGRAGLAIRKIANGYLRDTPPAIFHVIVNPLVTWMWIGAVVALGGALIAVWPAGARRRRVLPAGRTARPR
jgi:cytochrome c-type biogenesis protein CcmF